MHVTLLDLFLQHCFLALVSKKQLLSIYLVTTVLVYKLLQMYVATQSILYLTYHLLNRSTVKLNSLPVTQPSQVHDYASATSLSRNVTSHSSNPYASSTHISCSYPSPMLNFIFRRDSEVGKSPQGDSGNNEDVFRRVSTFSFVPVILNSFYPFSSNSTANVNILHSKPFQMTAQNLPWSRHYCISKLCSFPTIPVGSRRL